MATLLKADGTSQQVTPANKKHFTLDELQSFVGGLIEFVRDISTKGKTMVINEEGKLLSMPMNRQATELYKYKMHDVIVGDALLCDSKELR